MHLLLEPFIVGVYWIATPCPFHDVTTYQMLSCYWNPAKHNLDVTHKANQAHNTGNPSCRGNVPIQYSNYQSPSCNRKKISMAMAISSSSEARNSANTRTKRTSSNELSRLLTPSAVFIQRLVYLATSSCQPARHMLKDELVEEACGSEVEKARIHGQRQWVCLHIYSEDDRTKVT